MQRETERDEEGVCDASCEEARGGGPSAAEARLVTIIARGQYGGE